MTAVQSSRIVLTRTSTGNVMKDDEAAKLYQLIDDVNVILARTAAGGIRADIDIEEITEMQDPVKRYRIELTLLRRIPRSS